MGRRESWLAFPGGEWALQLNRQQALAELGVPGELYEELLHEFLDNAETALERLAAAIREDHLDQIPAIAHMLKGSAASLRLEEMRTIARDLEIAGRTRKGKKGTGKLIADLGAAVREFKALIS